MISDFKIFPKNALETAEFLCFVGLTAILRLLQRKSSTQLFLLLLIVAWQFAIRGLVA